MLAPLFGEPMHAKEFEVVGGGVYGYRSWLKKDWQRWVNVWPAVTPKDAELIKTETGKRYLNAFTAKCAEYIEASEKYCGRNVEDTDANKQEVERIIGELSIKPLKTDSPNAKPEEDPAKDLDRIKDPAIQKMVKELSVAANLDAPEGKPFDFRQHQAARYQRLSSEVAGISLKCVSQKGGERIDRKLLPCLEGQSKTWRTEPKSAPEISKDEVR